MAALICGVDVSSISLDARIGPQGAEARFDNDPEGVVHLAEFCRQQGVELVAMEATGGIRSWPLACFGAMASRWPC